MARRPRASTDRTPEGSSDIDRDKVVRIVAHQANPATDERIVAHAAKLIGRDMSLKDATDFLLAQFRGRIWFASVACQCGHINCPCLDYNAIGYLDGYVDEYGIGYGTQRVVLRWEPIDGEGVHLG